jgi:hypothetical protein
MYVNDRSIIYNYCKQQLYHYSHTSLFLDWRPHCIAETYNFSHTASPGETYGCEGHLGQCENPSILGSSSNKITCVIEGLIVNTAGILKCKEIILLI